MRLKKLELFGFKSFADRTEIFFDEGVTCVVGPNGCGKSNVSDSIRWVLGERSAKLLRGSKMEDVIFSGTEFRKPIAMAEVSLTIDNSDRGLPIDYNEVTLTRRLYRSGESEYLINKTVCRLKDLQDLILDTGIGSNSYSMIEQGRIDYVLNANADERRFLIEEAAGISKYKVKKEEAIRKLERTEENRLRLNDIIQEVHRNIQYAERQARRAERYREELEKLKRYEIQRAFQELDSLRTHIQDLETSTVENASRLEQNEQEVQSTRSLQEKLGEEVRETIDRYRSAESNRYKIQSQIDSNQQNLKFNQEKRISAATRQGQIDQEKLQTHDAMEKNRLEIESKEKEIVFIKNEKETVAQNFLNSEQALAKIESYLEEIKRNLDHYRSESFQAASETSKIRNEFHRLSTQLQSGIDQRRKQEAGIERLQEETRHWLGKRENLAQDLTSLQQRLQDLTAQKHLQDEEALALREKIELLRLQLEEKRRLLHEKETRYAMLKEINEQSNAGETELLASNQYLENGLAKKLRDLFEVTPGFEWAVEASLDIFSRSLVAEDIETAVRLIDQILEKKATSIGLFLKSPVPYTAETPTERPHHPKVLQALNDVVQAKEGYHAILEPFFRNLFLIETMSAQELMSEIFPLAKHFRFISPDGVLLGPEGRIYFRNLSMTSETNLFRRESEINHLQSEIDVLQSAINNHRSDLEVLSDRFEIILSEKESSETGRIDAAVQKESCESMLRSLDERLAAFSKEIELIHFEVQELESLHIETARQKQEAEESLHRAEELEKNLHEQFDLRRRDLEAADAEKAKALHDYAENKARVTHLEERTRLIQESLSILADHDQHSLKRIQQLEEETRQLAEKQSLLELEDAALEESQLTLHEARREADLTLELVRQEKEKSEHALSLLQTQLQELLQSHEQLQSNRHHFEMKKMDLVYQEKAIVERLNQAYRIQLEEFKREDFLPEGSEPQDLTKAIDDLKRKVESLGTVNLLAIEEYEELKKRYDFLLAQQKDLDEAREQLLETIRKINRTTKGLFEETFINVQKCFQEYYETLFRGGHAQLVLVDETNPLESGIDIVVRPPGKKPQHISLLSGGEKALTAIALLFALFKIKPSPFCVLDEVDAPLDEANVDRFLTVLKTFLQTSQFIIITHNRKTIAMGDSLYGVTMQEAGVSKIVSVKVNTGGTDSSRAATELPRTVEEPIEA